MMADAAGPESTPLAWARRWEHPGRVPGGDSMRSADYTTMPLRQLEELLLSAGKALVAADEEGGDPAIDSEAEGTLSRAAREVVQRGAAAEELARRLLREGNAEVRLYLAGAALEAGWETDLADSVLRSLTESKEGNGWPALYARKTRAMWRAEGHRE